MLPDGWDLPEWNTKETPVRTHNLFGAEKRNIFRELESRGIYFSEPLDLDFAMLQAFPEAYSVEKDSPDEATIKAVLGKKHHDPSQYSNDEQKLFNSYHQRFKLGSKPAAHIDALAQLTDEELLAEMPASLSRLADSVIAKLAELPE
ncbi:hypothetical protein LOC51_41100 [Rubrivivax sp. JA1024]|nr:hypothetical protein [Rubrivivax sp. JA1024]